MKIIAWITLLLFIYSAHHAKAQTLANFQDCPYFLKGGDPNYSPTPFTPAFSGKNISLLYDEGHNNFYKITSDPNAFLIGKYDAFAKLAKADGLRVENSTSKFNNPDLLKNYEIIVIAGAAAPGKFHLENGQWNPEIGNPAFSRTEITNLYNFVKNGGSLLIAANHAPLTDPVKDLLSAFGITTQDSTVLYGGQLRVNSSHSITNGISLFTTGGGGALHQMIGQNIVAYPPSIVAYGQTLPYQGNFPMHYVIESNLPNLLAIDFEKDLRIKGGGRVLISAHAGDFTSQQEFCGTKPYGHPQNSLGHNQQLTLNILSWLAKIE